MTAIRNASHLVVIPHKVNDLIETNSQPLRCLNIYSTVVIPHKVNDLIETNSQQPRSPLLQIHRCDSSQS